MVCVLVSFNGIIVIASVVASIPLFFVNKYVSSFWYKISVGRVEKQRYSDVLRDLMLRNDNIKELKLFGSLSYLKSRILNQQTDFFREDQMNRKKFCKIDTAQKAANDFVILLLKLWIIILGIKQRATLGTINLYTSSLDQIQSAIFSFCTQLNTFYEQALYLESLFDLFDMQTEDENCGTPLTEPIRTIEFRHVYFSYPATNVYALKNVSFVLDDRHTYALIGLNGSGKTTLLKLLMKLYKPTLGTILINGQDIEEIDTAGLRKRISAIFQDFIKYPFTAEENITISDLENANDLHRLSKVIDDAGAAEVIDGLPHRLQTQLQKGWNGGTELSQGQWQKIAIARCLFKQSDVYLFDEPFSALDAISEQDQFIEVSDEVAEVFVSDARHEMAYQRRLSRHKAQYSLDCDDGIEYSACLHEPTPQELLERMELFIRLWNALNSLPEIQGRRIDAHIILGKSIKEIAEAEGVHEESVRQSIKRGLERMKKTF